MHISNNYTFSLLQTVSWIRQDSVGGPGGPRLEDGWIWRSSGPSCRIFYANSYPSALPQPTLVSTRFFVISLYIPRNKKKQTKIQTKQTKQKQNKKKTNKKQTKQSKKKSSFMRCVTGVLKLLCRGQDCMT